MGNHELPFDRMHRINRITVTAFETALGSTAPLRRSATRLYRLSSWQSCHSCRTQFLCSRRSLTMIESTPETATQSSQSSHPAFQLQFKNCKKAGWEDWEDWEDNGHGELLWELRSARGVPHPNRTVLARDGFILPILSCRCSAWFSSLLS